jgi:hypothetical protein
MGRPQEWKREEVLRPDGVVLRRLLGSHPAPVHPDQAARAFFPLPGGESDCHPAFRRRQLFRQPSVDVRAPGSLLSAKLRLNPAKWGSIEVVAVACSLAIAALHLVFAAHAGPLWRDEAADVHFATMASWTEIWNHLHLDNFPPFLLAVLRVWAAAGLGATDDGYRV